MYDNNLNGSDQDSDSLYVTNQPDIVAQAKFCYENYPTIVNNIPKDSNHYKNTLHDFALVDNKLAAAQLDIGESSNLAQLALSYTYNFDDTKYSDYVCILSVLAQIAIDNAKRSFDVCVADEIKRIKEDMDVAHNQYPEFWLGIRKDFNKSNINKALKCPMNQTYNLKVKSYKPDESTLPISEFYIKHELPADRRPARKIQEWIEKYSIDLYKYNISSDDDEESYMLLRLDYEDLINNIRLLNLGDRYIPIMSWLINRAFMITPRVNGNANVMNSKLNKNRSLLLRVLYEVNPNTLMACFHRDH